MSALPATMTCIEITKYGGPEVLVPATRPVPQPKAGEILIKVAATAVNRPDIAQRMGGGGQALSRHQVARQARRRDLE